MTESETILDLEPPAGQLKTLLSGMTDDQLSARTPCEAFTVGDLLDHLMGLTIAFRMAAAKSAVAVGNEDDVPASTSGSGGVQAANVHPEWRRRLPLQLDELVAAWRDPASWNGMTEVGGISLPGAMAGGFALNELVLHSWDLASATGLAFDCDPAVAEASLNFTAKVVEQGFGDVYGPPVKVSDDAPMVDRLLALAGRDPSWTP